MSMGEHMFSSVTGVEFAGGNRDIGEIFTQHLNSVVSASPDASNVLPVNEKQLAVTQEI